MSSGETICEKKVQFFERIAILVIAISFVIWSGVFIYRSSFVGIDGKRYFSLVDDAMISMRYAWNFSHGIGLVWNQGELVEGYTNLLMTLLMSFATRIYDRTTAVLSIQVAGIGFMLATAYITMRISTHMVQGDFYRSEWLRGLSFLGVLAYYPLAYWSLMGMETGLLALLLSMGVLAALDYAKTMNPKFLFLVAAYMGLACLTRNDSIIFAVIVWSYVLWEIFDAGYDSKRLAFLLASIGSYLLFIIGQEFFRFWYYGELLPNTYTLKLAGIPLMDRIGDGLRFMMRFIIVTAPVLILCAIDLVVHFGRKKLLLFSIVISAIVYQIYVGGDPWTYWRMLAPSMPLAILLLTIAAMALVPKVLGKGQSRIVSRISILNHSFYEKLLICSVLSIGLLSANIRFLPEILLFAKPYQSDWNESAVNISIVINELTTDDASIGVITAGVIPYYTGRRAIDFLGKSDRYIANLPPDLSGKVSWGGMNSVPGHNKYDLNYSVETLKPTYAQGFVWGNQDITEWAVSRYTKVQYRGVILFLLKDSPNVYWERVYVP